MTESWNTMFHRWYFNLIPAYRGTGARITYISRDWRNIQVKLPLNWRTKNYVGTIFGGSIYGAVDPAYMIMLIKIMGPNYIVWDKAATIEFKKPGKSTLYAKFEITHAETDEIKRELDHSKSVIREYSVDLVDSNDVVHATIGKTLYIRRNSNESKQAP